MLAANGPIVTHLENSRNAQNGELYRWDQENNFALMMNYALNVETWTKSAASCWEVNYQNFGFELFAKLALSEKKEKRCKYLPPVEKDSQMVGFRDQILVTQADCQFVTKANRRVLKASPKDIEDLANTGRLAHVCPYFGSRRAIPQAEV